MGLREMVLDNRKCQHYYDESFFQTFGVKNQFFDPITGFDVIAFDEWLKVPDGKSTKEYLLTYYGENTVQMVYNMIHATINKVYPIERI